MYTIENIKIGAKLKRRNTIFIIDRIKIDKVGDTLVYTSIEGGEKGRYCNEIFDLLEFLNEQ
tara:strand:- start:3168 stop:3353 length:186 start_codon:yes stop_codon:yes gene_type:complete